MSRDRPTGSITGQDGWEWNRWHADQQTHQMTEQQGEQRTSNNVDVTRTASRQPSSYEQTSTYGGEFREFEPDLARHEQTIQFLITHYERLLAEKDRQLTQQRRQRDHESTSLVEFLRRFGRRCPRQHW